MARASTGRGGPRGSTALTAPTAPAGAPELKDRGESLAAKAREGSRDCRCVVQAALKQGGNRGRGPRTGRVGDEEGEGVRR